MKDDTFSLEGKNIKEIVDYADNLFRGDDNKKIEAHKIYPSSQSTLQMIEQLNILIQKESI